MTKYSCPNCQSKNTCRIQYGLPEYTEKLERDIEAGRVYLGGCEITGSDPNRYCNDCEIEFNTNATNIYLDIDGVLLANEKTAANYADEFIRTVLDLYPYTTHWLTTHCWRGENHVQEVLGPYLRPETLPLLDKIKPTEWGKEKTDAIDFNKSFKWFDDDLYEKERAILEQSDALEGWVEIDLAKDPDQLAQVIVDLQNEAWALEQ